MKFFVVHTKTGQEKKVKSMIEKAIEKQNLKERFGQIIVPVEHITKFKKGKAMPKSEEKKLYPGYIIVEMESDEETFKLVNSVPGVSHLLGTKTQPTPLEKKEVDEILEQIESGAQKHRPEIPFGKGEMVKVVNGPFSGFSGSVDEVFPDRRRIKVIVTIFGRPTPIDLDFFEVQPI